MLYIVRIKFIFTYFKCFILPKTLLNEGSLTPDTSLPPLSARQLYRISTACIPEMDLIMLYFSDFVIVVDYDVIGLFNYVRPMPIEKR